MMGISLKLLYICGSESGAELVDEAVGEKEVKSIME